MTALAAETEYHAACILAAILDIPEADRMDALAVAIDGAVKLGVLAQHAAREAIAVPDSGAAQ